MNFPKPQETILRETKRIAVGVAVYVAAALLFKAVTPDDFRSLRRGKKA